MQSKTKHKTIIMILLAVVGGSICGLCKDAAAMEVRYAVDPSHTSIGFKIKHLVISTVAGRFNSFTGNFSFDTKKKTIKSVAAEINASSIDTNEADRDKHLRSNDFFDVEKHPSISFKSKSVKQLEQGKVAVTGDLTIRGITKEIVLNGEVNGPVTDPWGNVRLAFSGRGEINRKDFGINWNKTLDKGGVMVGETVWLEIEGEGIEKK